MKMIITALLTAAIMSHGSFAASEPSLTVVAGSRVFNFSPPECVYFLKGGYLLGLEEKLDYICKTAYVAPKDSEIIFEPQNASPFTVTPEKRGARIDKERLKRDILDCLSTGGGAVKAVFHAVEPSVKRADLVKFTQKRGRFTTYFNAEQEERAHNISLAARLLNGVRIEKGEVFSFNEAVGARTKERGFKTAKVIVDGEFTDGLGGGVCQASTTLYNAALLSGMEIVEQHRHSLAVSYVEKSFDAMVSYGYADLRFKNVSGGPVFISAKAENGGISVCIYGESLSAEYRRESVIVKVDEPLVRTVVAEDLLEGEERTLTAPKTGYVSEGYLIEIKNGVETRKFLRRDEYKRVDGVKEVGSSNG